MTILLFIGFQSSAQFKRINKLNKNIFKEYDVKLYKESFQFHLDKKSESVKQLFCPDDATVFIKSEYIGKDTINGKVKNRFTNGFHFYNLVTRKLEQINDQRLKDSLTELMASKAVQVEKGSFDKKEAKEVAKAVGKEALSFVQLALTNSTTDKFENEFIVRSYYDSMYVMIKSLVVSEYPSNNLKSTSLKIKNEDRGYDVSFVFKGDDAFSININDFWLSPNGRFLLYKKYLLDLKKRKIHSLMEGDIKYMSYQFVAFTKNCENFIFVEDNSLRKNQVIDCIPVKEEIARMMTDMNRDSIYNLAAFADAENQNVLTDERDGQNYRWVKIGNQIWMADNLNYGQIINGGKKQDDNKIVEKYCYDDKEENCNVYGGLYQWKEIMDYSDEPGGICPKGWHIPSIDEWEILIKETGGKKIAGASLKESGTDHWKEKQKYLDEYASVSPTGFNALPGGLRTRISNGYGALGVMGCYRTSSNAGFYCFYDSEALIKHQPADPVTGYSVRCLKD